MLNVLNPEWAPGDKPVEQAWEEAYRRYEAALDLTRCRRRAFARRIQEALSGGRRDATTCDQGPCLDGGLSV